VAVPKAGLEHLYRPAKERRRTQGNHKAEIRADRNAYAHPDITVPLDEGPIVYDLCTGVMFYMAKEIEKLP